MDSEKPTIAVPNQIMNSVRAHEQILDFINGVNSNELVGFDSGKLKEGAKNNEAIDCLEKMDNSDSICTTSNILPTPLIDQNEDPMKKINSEIKPSAMLMMINLCCEHDWTLPTYEYYSERDPINKDPIWYARCIVKNHHITGVGSGKTIKEAKNNAAKDFCKKMDSSGDRNTYNLTTSNILSTPLIDQSEDPMKKITQLKCKINPTTTSNFCEKMDSSGGVDSNNINTINIRPTFVIDKGNDPMKKIVNSSTLLHELCNAHGLDTPSLGRGKSNNEAKNNAATDLLEKLDDSDGINTINSTTSTILPAPLIDQSEDLLEEFQDERIPSLKLHLVCKEHHWSSPRYKCSEKFSIQNNLFWYTASCTVLNQHITGLGSGKSKKIAKNNAATDFLKKLDSSGDMNTINSTTSNLFSPPLIDNNDDPKKEIKSFPISIGMLHKLCQQHNWKYPNYKIILEENRQENYSWYFAECSVDNHCTTGKGATKKAAKINSAYQMFIYLLSSAQDKVITPENKQDASPRNAILNKSVTGVNKMLACGMLHDFCQLHNLKLPKYEVRLEIENDQHNSSQYFADCNLYNYHTTGIGISKKTAKNEAASQMFTYLMNSAQNKIITPENKQYPNPINALLNTSMTDVNKTLEFPDSPLCIKQLLYRREKKNNFGFNRLMELNLGNESTFCAVNILDQIGIEEGFKIKYTPDISILSRISVIVEVAITPVFVNIGLGITLNEAQENAAFVALMYLKSLLDKFPED